jgi:hypothetical protein
VSKKLLTDTGGALLSGQIQPVQRGISFTVFDPADSPQAVTFDEHRNDVQEDRAWGAQCFKERADTVGELQSVVFQ